MTGEGVLLLLEPLVGLLELEDLFRELEPADRELLLERYFYGASPAEAAAKRGVSVSAVNTRVSRAKTRLAQTLERSGKR